MELTWREDRGDHEIANLRDECSRDEREGEAEEEGEGGWRRRRRAAIRISGFTIHTRMIAVVLVVFSAGAAFWYGTGAP
ncbi:hypothetical protein BO70DRAFT_357446 [Aspergillus heteromorphus CBS 117.55]|uniref:Uncharacterized protein n=1 Tax=Aspergillus heteromorphus CBS 117.55 TaxID=1448321 RepID=A0A317X115_9EURO|nr:uncharacterized protein BO70DRAFT_357446 [Aspergillus heteromorphus CBS 117.55]PWY92334.1 hypothetical protein BO70DRAFT_357446 [Aspergillus heteromorphus CBS 117.55]